MKTIKLLVEENKACSLPWYSAEVNFQDKKVTPCCKWGSPGFSLDEGFGNIWNGRHFKYLRKNIMELNTIEACHKCNDPNKYSYKDFKNPTLARFYNNDQNSPATPIAGKVKNLQFSASNICNLACRMCRPFASSTWGALVHKNPELKDFVGDAEDLDNKNLRKYIDSLLPELTEVEQITIAGGEPFMDPIVLELIKYVKQSSPNLKNVAFSTNMTIYNEEMFELLSSMKVWVQFGVSIDGPRDIHNYIRYNGSYDTIVENITKIKEKYPTFNFNVNTTCSILNAGYIKESLEGFREVEKQAGIKFRHIKNGPVFNNHLHAGLTPEPYKTQYLEKLDSITPQLLNIPNSKDMVVTARRLLTEQRPEKHYEDFVRFTKLFDTATKTDFEQIYWKLD